MLGKERGPDVNKLLACLEDLLGVLRQHHCSYKDIFLLLAAVITATYHSAIETYPEDRESLQSFMEYLLDLDRTLADPKLQEELKKITLSNDNFN